MWKFQPEEFQLVERNGKLVLVQAGSQSSKGGVYFAHTVISLLQS